MSPGFVSVWFFSTIPVRGYCVVQLEGFRVALEWFFLKFCFEWFIIGNRWFIGIVDGSKYESSIRVDCRNLRLSIRRVTPHFRPPKGLRYVSIQTTTAGAFELIRPKWITVDCQAHRPCPVHLRSDATTSGWSCWPSWPSPLSTPPPSSKKEVSHW